jgi:hypothetical protein
MNEHEHQHELKKCLEECMKKHSYLLFFTGGAALRALAQECYKKCKDPEKR